MSDAKPQLRGPLALDRRALFAALALFLVVGLTAYACVAFPRSQGRIAPIWLANAWIVAALLRTLPSRWPLLGLSALFGNILANQMAGDTLMVASGLSACNLIESLACAGIVRRVCGDRFDVGRIGHLMALVVGSMAGAMLSAVLAASFLGMVDHANVLRGLTAWAEADAVGLLTLAPCLLVISQPTTTPIAWRESWTLGLLALVAVGVFFFTRHPLLFAVLAALTLPTWRMGLPGAVAGVFIIAIAGTLAAFTGHGALQVAAPADRIVGLQIFLTISFFTSVPVAAARDAGERLNARLHAALAEARRARAEAEEAASVKTEFLANMSHELRTPLTSVVGFTRLAAQQPELSPLTRDYVERVSEASKALLCAVNDILDFSKLEAGQVSFRPEPFMVSPLAGSALALFTPQAAAKDLSLVLEDRTPAGLAVNLDPDRIRQVLLNLLGNAVKFTVDGQVTLTLDYDEPSERLAVEVADTGPGIAENRLDRLFKRFSQVDGTLHRGHGGTGLGLAICKGIVEAMGGEIGAQSTPGLGSRFHFSVPAPRAQTAPEPAPEAGEATRCGIRVLIADDHPANRDLVRLFLAAVGAEITEAPDGAVAADLAAQQPFDVILMDLRMPKLDGFEAVRRIRAGAGLNRATPILAFTADAGRALDGRLKGMGFDGAVAKPVDPSELISAISAAIAGVDDEIEVGAAVA